MKNWNDLLQSILSAVFEYAGSSKQLMECQLVCQKWSKPAQEQLYKNVRLLKEEPAKNFFTTIVISNTLPGRFVKYLYVSSQAFKASNSATVSGSASYTIRIVKFCPNIESLQLPYHDAIAETLTKERKEKGNLQAVRHVCLFPSSTKFLQNATLALAFRTTIEELVLWDGSTENSKPQVDYVDLYEEMAENIQDFKNVKKLKVEIYTSKCLYKLKSFLANFPFVTHLTFIPHRTPVSATVVEETNDDDNNTEDGIRERGAIYDLSQETICTKAKQFIGENIMLTNSSAWYLMHSFPHLENLVLNSPSANEDDRDHTEEAPQQEYVYPFLLEGDLAVLFFQYLANIQIFDIRFSFPQDNSILTIIQEFMICTGASLNTIMLEISYSDKQTKSSYPILRIRRSACYDGYVDINKDEISFVIEVSYSREITLAGYKGEDAQLPHLVLLDTFGKELNHLVFNAGGLEHYEKEEQQDTLDIFHLYLPMKCLFGLLTRCASLTSMYIRNVPFFLLLVDDSRMVRCDTMTSLTIEHGIIKREDFKQISARFPNLKNLKLSHCLLDDALLINLPKLALHNLTYKHEAFPKIYFYITESSREYCKEVDTTSGELKDCKKWL